VASARKRVGSPSDGPAPLTSHSHVTELRTQPALQRRDHMRRLLVGQLRSARNVVPPGETPSTAGRRRMLRDEYRMSPPRRLPPVVQRRRGRESSRDQLLRLHENVRQATTRHVVTLRHPEMKSAPKRRLSQPSEHLVQCSHSRTHALTHSRTHPLTHSPTHQLTADPPAARSAHAQAPSGKDCALRGR